jgi:hypothetical protein
MRLWLLKDGRFPQELFQLGRAPGWPVQCLGEGSPLLVG